MVYKLTKILFFLFALLLPFQTRYIFITGAREYSTIALYLLDIIFLMLVVLSPFFGKKNWYLVGGWVIGLVALILSKGQIEWYWWLRIAQALSVAHLIYRLPTTRKIVIGGLIYGAIFSSLVGIWQCHAQQITANSWLGMAAQAPWASGVAVLENMSGRLLRSYSLFPHPNIFGGYVALVLLLALARYEDTIAFFSSKWLRVAMLGLLTVGVFLSFSRGAALALIFGLVGLIIEKKTLRKTAFVIGALFLILNLFFYQFTIGRVLLDNRLEQISKNQRLAGTKIALEIIAAHPWRGVGLGQFTTRAAMMQKNIDPRYIEPVHNTYLLILSELGLIGVAILTTLMIIVFRRHSSPPYAILAAIAILGLFDHYLWTIYSSRILFLMLFPLVLLESKRANKIERPRPL